MTSPENFGPQFKDHIRLYRGVNTDGSEPRTERTGIHWSTKLGAAKRFSVGLHPEEDQFLNGDEDTARGHVIEALVPRGSINRSPGSEYNLGNSAEAEVPLLGNAPITVVGIHKTELDPKTYKIKLTRNPIDPKETRT